MYGAITLAWNAIVLLRISLEGIVSQKFIP